MLKTSSEVIFGNHLIYKVVYIEENKIFQTKDCNIRLKN